jgi:glycosyltransferase involved in cell wall biosynthesis
MKVLFVTRKYPPVVGGMELFAYDLSNALADQIDLKLLKWSGKGRAKAVLIAVPYLFAKAVRELMKGGIDIIHVNDGLMAPAGYLLSRIFHKPFTVVVHGLDITYTNRFFKTTVPWAVRRADQVFCISRAAAEEAVERGVPEEKLAVIPLAVHDELYGTANRETLLKHFEIPRETAVLLTVGRLQKRKGVAWFISQVMPGLVKEYPKLLYLVVGEGPEKANIEAAIAQTGLEENVRLAGRLEGEVYAAAYNAADVFVMPNIKVPGDVEGFGLVLLEASLCARPLVAADLEGIRDAVADGKNGVLVPSKDTRAFQKAVGRFLKDKQYAARFGRQSRAYSLRNYQWPAIASRYVEHYRQILTNLQSPR